MIGCQQKYVKFSLNRSCSSQHNSVNNIIKSHNGFIASGNSGFWRFENNIF